MIKTHGVFIAFTFVLFASARVNAQDTLGYNSDSLRLYYLVNVVPDGYDKAVNGIVNIAKGSHESYHIGIFNCNQKNFKGLQLSCFNIIRGNLKGVQVAFFNNCFDTLKGTQVGVVNITNVNKGNQIGVINYSDTAAGCFSLGYFSVFRRGSYHAIEYYVSERLPMNISYKIGLPKAYNMIDVSTDATHGTVLVGGGVGFMKPMNSSCFFNPEILLQSALGKHENLLSVNPKFTFRLNRRIYFSVGPSFAWDNSKTREMNAPLFALVDDTSANGKNKLLVGLIVAVRFTIAGVTKKNS